MLPSSMKINKRLLPIKGHFFFFNAGTGPLVPYLSTYARQLGFSSATVGLIYTVLPIFGLIAKPLFGIIADRYKLQKLLFIIFQVVIIVSFSSIYFIPQSINQVAVELDCGDGATFLKSCYKSQSLVDTCKVNYLGNLNETAFCHMNCDMSSPKLWQTVCEHWHIPKYCYSSTENIKYQANVTNFKINDDDHCVYFAANNVTIDGYSYIPHCRLGAGYIDLNEPCSLTCNNANISTVIATNTVNMTCLDKNLHYRLCSDNVTNTTIDKISKEQQHSLCLSSCDLDTHQPWRLMEICEGWGADAAASCQPKTGSGEEFPSNISFVGHVPLSKTISEHECVYMELHEIQLPDGSIHYPSCVSSVQYQTNSELFQTLCNITCDNAVVNEIFQSANESNKAETSQYSKQFWMFFILMIINWVGQAVVVSIADAITFNVLGDDDAQYGKQRLWGSVGFGIFSLLTGSLIDVFSDGAYKDYTIAFVFMFVFLCGDVVVSSFLRAETSKVSYNILTDVGALAKSLPTCIFFIWTVAVGLCTGLLWNFLFWHIETISESNCDGSEYVKTLQGLVSAIQTFGGEIPFMFVSGYIIKKVGHTNMMSIVLFAFGVRFILYSYVTNAWWILPIELFQGITYGMFYPTMTSYANVVSPAGTETTVQSQDVYENTFKHYYYGEPSNEDNSLEAENTEDMDELFKGPMKKKTKKSSTVARPNNNGGVTYISTNRDDDQNSTHLIKIEIYDLKKLNKIPQENHWKHTDLRIKYYATDKNVMFQRIKKLAFNISKDISDSPSCHRYSYP